MKYLIGIIGLVSLGAAGWYMTADHILSDDVKTTGNEQSSLQVVASIYPLAFIAEEIISGNGQVTNIGSGQDPHDFRPTARDIQTMQDSDLMILQGAELEPWGEEVQEQLIQSGNMVLVATQELSLYELEKEHNEHDEHEKENHDDHDDKEHEDEHDDVEEHHDEHEDEDHHEEEGHDEHNHGLYDPHTWLDPVLMSQISETITNEIIAIDPENRSLYEQNLANLQEQFSVLDNEYAKALNQCELNEVITAHDAFGYVARRYGFEIHTIAGLSTQDQPSVVTLAELREEAQEGIGAILLEDNNIKVYGETLASETGLQTMVVNPVVYNIPEGSNYFDIMRSNLDSFKTALQCNG